MSSSVGSWPGSTLEDWLKWLAGKATRYWWVHVRYYWACWIFGTDPRKTVSLNKRDSLKRAGVSQQTLEQRSSYETGPEWSRKLTDCMCIVPLLNTHSWQLNSYSASSHNLTLHGPIYMSVASLHWWNLFARPLWLPVTAEVIVATWHRRWQPDCPVPLHEHCSFALPEIVLYLLHSYKLLPQPIAQACPTMPCIL